jgi:hypothetical protein
MAKQETTRLVARSIKASDADWNHWANLAAAAGLPLTTWIKQLIRREELRIARRQKL